MNVQMRYSVLIVLCFLSAILSCTTEKPENQGSFILYDFETDEELDYLHWECGTVMERDSQWSTSGRFSLRVDMYSNSEYPGFKCSIPDGLAGYRYLRVDIHSSQVTAMKLAYRIDDRPDSPPYTDRANGSFMINPGDNVFSLDLEQLKTSGTDRKIDLGQVKIFLLFVHRPLERKTIFLDHIRLDRQ